jgi:hypothetical protein
VDVEFYHSVLQELDVELEAGLSEEEIERIQATHGFQFPPDLREFLAFALPVSDGFVNWRDATNDGINRRLAFPYERLFLGIQYRSFWPKEWGMRPRPARQAFTVARSAFEKVPALIPINRHRYIPDRPNEPGNPVFSVYQVSFTYFGANLAECLRNEFGLDGEFHLGRIKHVEFWSDLAAAPR